MYFSRYPEMSENVGRKISSLVNLEQALHSVLSVKLIAMITRELFSLVVSQDMSRKHYQGRDSYTLFQLNDQFYVL